MSSTNIAPAPTHTNRLINSTSPYLLQHAHNPVDWYPWCDEAFNKAAEENKPVFLSIGYSACHWCHVMERESFENHQIAEILNRHFVSIKVDREERPDLDEIYMKATILYNRGQGGWPMSVFLTPDQKPFFAGTYFPPQSRWGVPGFKDLLLLIAKAWETDRDKIIESSESLSKAVEQLTAAGQPESTISLETVDKAVKLLTEAFDQTEGGIISGNSNKFPPSLAMSLMLRQYHRSSKQGQARNNLLTLVTLTLDRMADGGIYDHLAGGFARYSTDPEWLVPHFEKMLYDQALISSVYLEAYQLTGRQRYAQVAKDIFDYVLADLQSPEGGFYSSRDADSEGVEGKYYVWSKSEVLAILGDETGEIFCNYYGITDQGNWEGQNILNIQQDIDDLDQLHGIETGKLQEIMAEARAKLLSERAKRKPPGLDDKILTAWNGLMIAALARGGRVTGETKYTQAAIQSADFILNQLSSNGRLLRSYRNRYAHTLGYLDDYAFFVEGLLELYQSTFDSRWLLEAIRLNDDTIEYFWDELDGGFFFTADDAEELIVRIKDGRDGVIPSGNSAALMNLCRLNLLLKRDDLADKAGRTIRAFSGTIDNSPLGFERFLAAVDFHLSSPATVIIVGLISDSGTRALI
ncbi:MAG: thioredoxin domain-containing protein, partial [Planctomycetota bacterium]